MMKGKNVQISHFLAVKFQWGKLPACVASRPGERGQAGGCEPEGVELKLSLRNIKAKKGK